MCYIYHITGFLAGAFLAQEYHLPNIKFMFEDCIDKFKRQDIHKKEEKDK